MGIELDTEEQEIRLLTEKLEREIGSWINTNQRCYSFGTDDSVVILTTNAEAGRYVTGAPIRVRLNAAFHADLAWLDTFLESWNGTSMTAWIIRSHYAATIISDASGTWGCGAFSSMEEWFQFEWPEGWKEIYITIKELLLIVLSAAVWGHHWSNCTVRQCRSGCHCEYWYKPVQQDFEADV